MQPLGAWFGPIYSTLSSIGCRTSAAKAVQRSCCDIAHLACMTVLLSNGIWACTWGDRMADCCMGDSSATVCRCMLIFGVLQHSTTAQTVVSRLSHLVCELHRAWRAGKVSQADTIRAWQASPALWRHQPYKVGVHYLGLLWPLGHKSSCAVAGYAGCSAPHTITFCNPASSYGYCPVYFVGPHVRKLAYMQACVHQRVKPKPHSGARAIYKDSHL